DKGPSSILLMAAACPLFEYVDKRDDSSLLNVVKGIPASLQKGVMSPIDPESSLTAHMTREALADAVEQFQIFAKHLEGAINATDAQTAYHWVYQMLGNRFPNEPHRMKSNAQSLPSSMAVIPPLAGPAEPVKRTKAG
ncbi:MAG: hypothetical protein Q8S49_06330, partial [Pseudomonas sp.]|nr:hypothetical protein [Pseudomonas sp.]